MFQTDKELDTMEIVDYISSEGLQNYLYHSK